MNGFSYENTDGVYELHYRKSYVGDEDELQKFAVQYWTGPKPLVLCLEDGIRPEDDDGDYVRIKNGLRGWLLMKGLDRFIKETATENRKEKEKKPTGRGTDPRWERDIENLQTLVHIATYQAVQSAMIKKV